MISTLRIPANSPSQVALRYWLGLVLEQCSAPLAMQARARPGARLESDAGPNLDARDVREARGGNDGGAAFERIVRRHQQEVARRLRRFSRDPLVVQELVQETFVQAFFSLNRYRSDAPLIHWLHRIAVRAGYRFWKNQRRQPRTISMEAQTLVAPEARVSNSDALDRVMQRLSPRDRLVLTLMYLEDHSVGETAQLTGWSWAMVKVQAHRARGRLRKLIQQERARDKA